MAASPAPTTAVEFSPDGARLAAGTAPAKLDAALADAAAVLATLAE